MATEVIAWASWVFGLFILGLSVGVLGFYATRRHKYFAHIALMGTSYCILTVIMVLTINYRIFYDGVERFVGAMFLLLAYVMGTWGLLLIIKRRAVDVAPREDSQ